MRMEGEERKPALRLHQAIASRLGTAILSGDLQPGDGLAGEIEESERQGVSRTAYREAIRILIAKGMIESRPKIGTHVTPRCRWNLLDPDVLAWMFSGKPDENFVHDLFELREVIEPAAAAMAARRRTPEQLEAMQESLALMGRHGLADPRGQAADQEFHRLLLEATHNSSMISLSSTIGSAVMWTTRFKQRMTSDPRDPLPDHERLLEAVAEGAEDGAAAAMRELIRLALADMGPVGA